MKVIKNSKTIQKDVRTLKKIADTKINFCLFLLFPLGAFSCDISRKNHHSVEKGYILIRKVVTEEKRAEPRQSEEIDNT